MSDHMKYLVASITGITVVVLAGVLAIAYTSQSKSQLMAKDVQAALDKGVNPIVIRCAYADEGDRICLVYAATRSNDKVVDMMSKTK